MARNDCLTRNGETLPKFSVVLPYYNEYHYIADTLDAWLHQRTRPAEMILIDNGSTDGSAQLVKNHLRNEHRIQMVFLMEPRPGKIHALQTGIAHSRSPFIALSDADTYYPPHYLELGSHLFSLHDETLSAVMALPEFGNPHSLWSKTRRQGLITFQKLWRKHAFTGGHGQLFRRQALLQAGGFSESFWSYVLLDHEIMYRIFKKGSSLYHRDLWCCPSARRQDRTRVRWNLPERFLYHLTPHCLQGWFFYHFLKNRFEARGLSQERLREKPWEIDLGGNRH
jgi:glycosyltransferase involved in cell wall biosynthesis